MKNLIKKMITVGNLPIEITRRKGQKNLYIRIQAGSGLVTVSAPWYCSDRVIKDFVLEKQEQIRKAREKAFAQVPVPSKRYETGELHSVWGKSYPLYVLEKGTSSQVVQLSSQLLLMVPFNSTMTMRKEALEHWYRQQLQQALPKAIQRCEAMTQLKAQEYKIKNMKTRWGTCNIAHKRIWINLQLVKKPPECLDYVLVHELVHLLERNHTPRFHALVTQFYPTWKEVKQRLDSKNPVD